MSCPTTIEKKQKESIFMEFDVEFNVEFNRWKMKRKYNQNKKSCSNFKSRPRRINSYGQKTLQKLGKNLFNFF